MGNIRASTSTIDRVRKFRKNGDSDDQTLNHIIDELEAHRLRRTKQNLYNKMLEKIQKNEPVTKNDIMRAWLEERSL